MKLTLTIAVFGRLAESVGSEFSLDVEGPCRVAELRKLLAQSFPGISGDLLGGKVRFCVDDRLVPDNYCIEGRRRVEMLSPLSGG